MINDVLDLAKIESGKMEAFAEDFDVGSLIDQVVGTVQPLMSKNNNQLIIEHGEIGDVGDALAALGGLFVLGGMFTVAYLIAPRAQS